MIVKCDMVDCLYNGHCKCEAGTIGIVLNHDKEGIGRIECDTYQHDPDFKARRLKALGNL